MQKSQEVKNFEFDLYKKQGGTITVKMSARVLDDYENLIQATFLDISDEIQKTKDLQRSEAYLKTIVDAQPQIMIVTQGNNLIMANKKMLQFCEFESVEQFKTRYDCICDLFVSKKGYLHKTMGEANWVEYILQHPNMNHKALIYKDTKMHTFGVSATNFIVEGEELAVVMLSDITHDEDIMIRYKFALEGSSDGIWDVDLVSKSVYFSPRWKMMLGYNDIEIANEADEWWHRIHPDDVENVKKTIDVSLHHKDEKYENIHRLKHKSGDWVWIYSHGKVLFDNEGNPSRIVCVNTDITSLKLQQEELKKLDMILQQTPFGMMITDPQGVITYSNKFIEELMGYSAVELAGTKIIDYVHKNEANQKQMNTLKKSMQNNEFFIGDIVMQRKDGSLYKEHNMIAAVYVDNTLNCYIGIKQESNEMIELQTMIKEQEQMLIAQSRHAAMGEMVGMIAHQWRQPISIISMGVNNILADIELNSFEIQTTKQDLKDILKQTEHLSSTIDDFRNFFKPDKETRVIDLNESVQECLNIIGKSLTNNDIKVILQLDAKQQITTYDRELLQVLINIVKNAKEAIVEQKSKERFVSIETLDSDDSVIISICDSGGGIAKEVMPKVFDPYFSTKDEQNGTGLGLYMSKTIVEKHLEGQITVENSDVGACFKLKLPISHTRKGDE